MALTQRGKVWEYFQSWFVLLSVPFGFTTFLAFLYAGIRARRWLWIGWAAVYLGLNVYVVQRMPETNSGVPVDDLTMAILGGVWLAGIIHVFLIRKKYLLLLEARLQSNRIEDDLLRAKIQASYGVSDSKIDAALVEFKESDTTVKIAGATLHMQRAATASGSTERSIRIP